MIKKSLDEVIMLKIIPVSDICTQIQSSSGLVNASIIEHPEHVTVVDTMLLPRDSRSLAEHLKTYHKAVKYIINTHWHSDHCYGNRFIANADSCIIAHEKHLETISCEKIMLTARKSIVEKSKLCRPHLTFDKLCQLDTLPSIQIKHSPGHSPDSSIVFLATEKLLMAGDTILNGPEDKIAIPYFYWGSHAEILDSLKNIQKMEIETIIPGHGPACTLETLKTDIEYLEKLKTACDEIHQNSPAISKEKLIEICQNEIILTACVSGSNTDDFWVPVMHKLNIECLCKELFSQ